MASGRVNASEMNPRPAYTTLQHYYITKFQQYS